eukprot:UN33263
MSNKSSSFDMKWKISDGTCLDVHSRGSAVGYRNGSIGYYKHSQYSQKRASVPEILKPSDYINAKVQSLSLHKKHDNYLASSDSNGKVVIWDIAKGSITHWAEEHLASVYKVIWHNKEHTKVYSCSLDKTVRVLDLRENRNQQNKKNTNRKPLIKHSNPIVSMQFTPCGKYLFLGTSHGVVDVYDIRMDNKHMARRTLLSNKEACVNISFKNRPSSSNNHNDSSLTRQNDTILSHGNATISESRLHILSESRDEDIFTPFGTTTPVNKKPNADIFMSKRKKSSNDKKPFATDNLIRKYQEQQQNKNKQISRTTTK